jgi:hypothetical protein
MPVTLRIPSFALILTAVGLASTLTLIGCSQTQKQVAPAAVASTPLPTNPDTVVIRMGEYLKTLTAFTLSPEISYDEVLPSSPKIQHLGSAVMNVRRPDRLRADISGDDGERTVFYDGKSLTVYGRILNVFATVDAPPTLDEMFAKVLNEYDLGLPLVDILYQSVHGTLLDDVKAGMVVGRSRVRGVECDQVAFHQDDVDWQLWVEASATPLPRRIVITTLGETGQPQYQADLNWNLSPKIDDSMFVFVPPRDAARIKLATLAAEAKTQAGSRK